jgi:hypothetical protein
MIDPMSRGGVRRYLDTVKPEEYLPNTGEVNLREMTLTGLCDLYGSDKGTIKHRYTDVYERLIDRLILAEDFPRADCDFMIAEAGIACGASLRAFANYLPGSTIYGYDIRPECAGLCENLHNVNIVIDDPAKMEAPDFCFDIFIDDASHISEQIVAMFENCWDWVRPGGYYVIEDLRCTYNKAYTEQFRSHFDPNAVNDRRSILDLMDTLMRVVDARGPVKELSYYPQMLVIRKDTK